MISKLLRLALKKMYKYLPPLTRRIFVCRWAYCGCWRVL